jgi:hypothetical protein
MPNAENGTPLTVEETNELLRLAAEIYQKQADRCFNAGAFLAGCIMAGAAVEAILMAVTCFLYDDAVKAGKAPRRKGKIAPY